MENWTVVRKVFTLSKFFGIYPIGRVRWSQMVIFPFWVVLWIYISVMFLFSKGAMRPSLIRSYRLTFSHVLMYGASVRYVLTRKRLTEAYDRVGLIHKVLIGYGLRPRYKEDFLLNLFSLVFFMVHYLTYTRANLDPYGFLFFNIPLIRILVPVLEYCVFLKILSEHFSVLTDQLHLSSGLELRKFILLHSQVADLVNQISTLYCPEIIMFFVYYFFSFTDRVFTNFRGVDGAEVTVAKRIISPSFLMWGFYYVYNHLTLIGVCTSTELMENKFTKKLVDLCRKLENRDKASLVLLHHLMKRDLRFDNCGLLRMERPLIKKMLGAITTYSVILQQFYQDQNAPVGLIHRRP